MVQFEVTQIDAVGYPGPSTAEEEKSAEEQAAEGSVGVCVDLYIQRQKKKLFASCRKRTKKTVTIDKGSSPTVDDVRDARWRSYNEDGFQIPVVVLNAHGRLVAEVRMLAEVSRVLHNGTKKNILCATGLFKLGRWGCVPLNSETEGFEEVQIRVEVRPSTSRPFKLENCRPHEDRAAIVQLCMELKTSTSKSAKRRSSSGSTSGNVASHSGIAKFTNPNKPKEAKKEIPRKLRPSISHTSHNAASSGSKDAEVWSSAFVKIKSDGQRTSGNDATGNDGAKRRGSALLNVKQKMQPGGGRRQSAAGFLFGRSPSVLIAEEIRTVVDPLRGNEWLPGDEWMKVWKGTWPVESEVLPSKYQVQPLMEDEFKHDCIVFFNTLFPRIMGRHFQLIASTLLNPNSKYSFKVCRGANNQSMTSILTMQQGMDGDGLEVANHASSTNPKKFGRKTTMSLALGRKSVARGKSILMRKSLAPIASANGWDGPEHEGTANKLRHAAAGANGVSPHHDDHRKHNQHNDVQGGNDLHNVFAEQPSELRTVDRTAPVVYGRLIRAVDPQSGSDDNALYLEDDYSARVWFLKRMFICFAACGVYFSEEQNTLRLGDLWPYPLASLLAHGGRILIRLEDVEASELLNFLITGNKHGHNWRESWPPPPLIRRIAATHDVQIHRDTGQLTERKLRATNLSEVAQNLNDGLQGRHLGIDMPLGGVGNPSPLGGNHVVGHAGQAMHFEGKSEPDVPEKIQGGHLYVRVDEFGDCVSRGMAGSSEKEKSLKDRVLASLKGPLDPDAQESRAGLLMMAGTGAWRPRRLDPTSAGYGVEVGLMRVSSEPNLKASRGSTEDLVWVRAAAASSSDGSDISEPPPSVTALELLLDRVSPLNLQRFGTGKFKSLQAFYEELNKGESVLALKGEQVCRYVEPTLVQLNCCGHVLVLKQEVLEDKRVREKNTFVSTRKFSHEEWHASALRAVGVDLELEQSQITQLLNKNYMDESLHSVVEEERESPSYPGVVGYYRTHMVLWEIADDTAPIWLFGKIGWPIDSRKRSENLYGADFQIDCKTPSGCKSRFWRWVPQSEAQNLWNLNINNTTQTLASPDEKWAQYAYKKEGVVQFPPTEGALAILLRQCGVDVGLFGADQEGKRFKTMNEFWRELTIGESYLEMRDGKPMRLVEPTFVRFLWKNHVLVQLKETMEDGRIRDANKLLANKKKPEEQWHEAALRCVADELHFTKSTLAGGLQASPTDPVNYLYLEERKESPSYPGILCLYRTHLITYEVKDVVPEGFRVNRGLPVLPSERATQPYCCDFLTKQETKLGEKTLFWKWSGVEEATKAKVRGMQLYEEAKRCEERHQISSLLIGLEGTAPQKKSPFGHEHDASGKSGSTACSGGRKWRAYRKNNALQIPAESGGMRMRITEPMFEAFQKLCEGLDLMDPQVDFNSLECGAQVGRMRMNQRHAEKELFKQILSSNGEQAMKLVQKAAQWRRGGIRTI